MIYIVETSRRLNYDEDDVVINHFNNKESAVEFIRGRIKEYLDRKPQYGYFIYNGNEERLEAIKLKHFDESLEAPTQIEHGLEGEIEYWLLRFEEDLLRYSIKRLEGFIKEVEESKSGREKEAVAFKDGYRKEIEILQSKVREIQESLNNYEETTT